MSALLEIFGRAITADTADLIWHWLNAVKLPKEGDKSPQVQQLTVIIDIIGNMKLDAAQEQLRLYLFENPSCTYGRLAAAAICLHKNRLHEAIEQLNSVYLRQPNNIMALYALGHCFERLGQESKAVEFYQDCLKFKNYLQFPSQRLAAIYFKNGQLEKTIQQYQLLKEQYPDDISTLVTLGHLYIASTEYTKAIETFNTAILIHPDNFLTESDNNINELIHTGQLHEALQQLEDLLRQQPDRADLIVKQADVLSLLGASADAISQYQQALRICPDSLEATVKLGTQYLQINAEQLAAQLFNKAVEINDKIVDAYIGLATAQKLAGYLLDAFGTLSLAAAIQPNSSFLFAETATLLFKAALSDNLSFSNADNSTELLETVIEAHLEQISRHQNPDLHYRLGVLLMSVGRINSAIESFKTALEINPTYGRARSKLAVCLLEAGQKDAAIEQLISFNYLDKYTLNLHYRTSLLYCNKIKFASSLINLDRYMEDNFASSDSAFNISIVLQNLGLLDRVSAMWENLSDTTIQAINSN